MKTKITITTVLILISIIIGCSSKSKASGSGNNPSPCVWVDERGYRCIVNIIKVRGHEYLVSYTNSERGGTCIIHAAHCPCHQTK